MVLDRGEREFPRVDAGREEEYIPKRVKRSVGRANG